jgi:PAS domain-containing protein
MLIGGFMTSWQKRLTAEKNLAKSEQRLRDLVNTLNEGVWEADAEMATTFVNPKRLTCWGINRRR